MASVNGVRSSNMTSSLYNSANVISGLASGLDTEGMIEGLVQSYQTKIQNLTNKATKLEWKQDAYRSIISKMYAFTNKYTSYSSATNLMSSSFFTNAIKVAALGANKDKVTAAGRTESDVRLNSVKQLATAARYNTQSNLKGVDTDFSITPEKAISFMDDFDTSAMSGSLTLSYGDKTVSVVFDASKDIIEDKVYALNEDGSYKLDDKGKRIVERTRTSAEKAADLQKMIEKKLSETSITLSNGESRKANELIDVKLSGSSISFKDKSSGRNNVYMSDASASVKKTLGLDLEDADEKKPASFSIGSNTNFVKTQSVGSYISGATMNISLDGKTKTIKLPTINKTYDGFEALGEDGQYAPMSGDDYAAAVQKALDKEFGVGKIKVTNDVPAGADGEKDPNAIKLTFKAPDNSDLVINTDVGKALGIGNVATNYLSTGKTLGEVMDAKAFEGLTPARAAGKVTTKDGKRYDELGREVNIWNSLIDSDGNELYEFKINGAVVGNYGKNTRLSTIMNDINNNKEAGVKVSYSQTTRQFSFVSKDTGSENKIELGEGLAQKMFGAPASASDKFSDAYGLNLPEGGSQRISFDYGEFGHGVRLNINSDTTMKDVVNALNSIVSDDGYTASFNETAGQLILTDKTGKSIDLKVSLDGASDPLKAKSTSTYVPGRDAVFTVEVNGQELEMTRGSNSASIDGMTLTFKDTFNESYKIGDKLETEAVSFQRSTDSDKIVDAVKSMIADYNEMMAEIKSAYGTLPYQDSKGAFKTYEPLSDEDKASMSESAIQNYEAKAKQGLLFNDTNLSMLYQRMSSVFNLNGEDAQLLKRMGITWSYSSDNNASLALDENKLREVLDSDPDAVADLFTRSSDVSGGTNGIMQNMKVQLDRYAGTTGAVKGILIQQAGSPLSSLSLMNNDWQKQIDNLGTEIQKWQDKLSAQVDKYTSMFSKLETLIYQMNSQSSTLAGLMGMG